MRKYLFKRCVLGLVAVLLSSVLMFFLMRALPGSPVGRLIGYENYDAETAQYIIKKHGLDQPVYTQFAVYITNLLKGDWGYSYISGKPVWEIILPKLLPTVALAIPSALISFFIGLGIAIKSENMPRMASNILDAVCNFVSAVPNYIMAFILLYFLAHKARIFPSVGMTHSRYDYQGVAAVMDFVHHLILPVSSLCIVDLAYYYKVIKSSIRKELKSEYVSFLRTNGVSQSVIMGKYILKNAVIPAINIFSMSMTRVVTGALYIEILFAWPGLGRLLYQSIMDRDYLVLSAGFFLITVVVVLFMLIVDVVHALIDPRIRRKINGS